MVEPIEIKSENCLIKIIDPLKGIIGEICWEAHFSYPDILILEIGEKIPSKFSVLKRKFDGEWSIGTQGSFWVIKHDNIYIVDANEERGISDKKIKVLENKKITDIKILYPSLSLVVDFEDNYNLIITPPTPDVYGDEYNDVSDWEVFLPGNMIIEMMPKNRYYHRRSDVFYEK